MQKRPDAPEEPRPRLSQTELMGPTDQHCEVIGTSVMLESVDFAEDDWRRFWEDPVERRALQRAVADHRAVVIKAQVFVDVKANGRVERVSGTQWWPQEIWLDRDPTNQLIERAYDGHGDAFECVNPGFFEKPEAADFDLRDL